MNRAVLQNAPIHRIGARIFELFLRFEYISELRRRRVAVRRTAAEGT